MAEIKIDYKGLLARININRSLYIVAFFLIVMLLSLYSVVLNHNSKKEMKEMYVLKEKHDKIEEVLMTFEKQIQKSLAYSLLYISDRKELFRFQALEELNDANISFNMLFAFAKENSNESISSVVQLRESLVAYENSLLQKLAMKSELPEMEFSAIYADEDTLYQDLSAFEPVEMTQSITMAEEEILVKTIESSVFELNVLLASVSEREAKELSEQGIFSTKLFGLYVVLILLVFLLLYYLLRADANKRIAKSSHYLQLISSGVLPEKIKEEKDDFREIIHNGNLISDYMHDASEFALSIGDGNFKYEFSPKSEDDRLGNALIQMRDKLQEVAVQDRIRNWTNEGQAKFGEILRDSGSDLEEMGDKIISNLVDYVGASMGAMYMKNEDRDVVQLELLSAFAFNRKKHLERRIEVGEGLAGQVFVEKKKVFLKEIKSDHFDIVTGMGHSKPASVLIVPLKDENNDVEGVIEIASLNVFEEYQIKFIEKLGESIASAIKSGKTNTITKHLLAEMQTREEEMRTQEEELKQNMEELSATQEQMERLRKEDQERKSELESKRQTLFNVLDTMESCVYVKDSSGRYQFVNRSYSDVLNWPVDKIVGSNDFELLGEENATQRQGWEKSVIKTGVPLSETEEFKGKSHSLHLYAIELSHLGAKGVMGVF